jgi:TrmH family RNA methyltransferase
MLGRHHPLLKRIRGLRRDPDRRRIENVVLAEGAHLAREALRSEVSIELAVVSSRLTANEEGRILRRDLIDRGIELHEAPDDLLESLQDARGAQPVVCLVEVPRHRFEDCLRASRSAGLAVIAHGIQDPGNLGGILRTAHAAGAGALMAVEDGADLTHPRTVRAAMGSTFRLPNCRVGLAALETALREEGFGTVGTAPRAESRYDEIQYQTPVALFLGNEGSGLPRDLLDRMDVVTTIPMQSDVESLSVGAAAAVLLFDLTRRLALGQ